jgi:hypothetical protein
LANREQAVEYAQAYQIEQLNPPAPIGRVTQRLNPASTFPPGVDIGSIPFANFPVDVNHGIVDPNADPQQEKKFGSAVFISESLWMGGMPMTREVGLPTTSSTTCGLNPETALSDNRGWRHCTTDDGTASGGNTSWMRHHWLVPYYTENYLPPDRVGESVPVGIVLSNKGHAVPSQSPGEALFAITRNSINGITVQLNSGRVTDPGTLANNVFETLVNGESEPIQAGDYAWIDSTEGGTTHGLLVAGWGEAEHCETILQVGSLDRVILDEQRLYSTYSDANSSLNIDYPVPYVVDS